MYAGGGAIEGAGARGTSAYEGVIEGPPASGAPIGATGGGVGVGDMPGIANGSIAGATGCIGEDIGCENIGAGGGGSGSGAGVSENAGAAPPASG